MITLRFVSNADPDPSRPQTRECFRGRLFFGSEPSALVSVRVNEEGMAMLGRNLDPGTALQLALPELSMLAESGQLLERDNGSGVIPIEFTGEDIEAVKDRLQSKSCAYQRGERPALLCSAAPSDSSAVTFSDCIRCSLPDADVLCRWSAHVKIRAGRNDGMGRPSYWTPTARCGRPEDAAEDARNAIGPGCGPGLNSCWEVLLSDPDVGKQPETGAAEVLELLDHLDTAWRLQPNQGRLFGPGSFTQVAAILKPVGSLSDFRSATNDLVQLFNRARPNDSSNGKHLARIQELVAVYSETGAAAIATLRDLVHFRDKLEHSPREAQVAASKIGLRYPGESWQSTWSHLLGITASALRTAIGEIKFHVDESEI